MVRAVLLDPRAVPLGGRRHGGAQQVV